MGSSCNLPAKKGDLLPDPGSSMSLTAVLVMTVVVLVLLGAWLIAVFRAAHEPASGHRYPGGQDTARGARRQASARGADAAAARHSGTPRGQANQAAAEAGKAGSPSASTARDP